MSMLTMSFMTKCCKKSQVKQFKNIKREKQTENNGSAPIRFSIDDNSILGL